MALRKRLPTLHLLSLVMSCPRALQGAKRCARCAVRPRSSIVADGRDSWPRLKALPTVLTAYSYELGNGLTIVAVLAYFVHDNKQQIPPFGSRRAIGLGRPKRTNIVRVREGMTPGHINVTWCRSVKCARNYLN